MPDRVQNHKPTRPPETQAWLDAEKAAQETRYAAIAQEMSDLQPERNRWIDEFLSIIQTRGFNMNGDMRRPIAQDEVPTRPDRPDADKVVW